MGLRKDIWRPAIVRAPLSEILERGGIEGLPFVWLPESKPFCFLADPFGLWRDELLHVFVETYDYRVRVGAIEVLRYDADLVLIDREIVLSEPWHLSYPFVFEADGETWMLPEAHRSGKLTLYRADPFPHRWIAEAVIELDHVAVDATPIFFEGRWWLFHASADNEPDKTGALFAAFADRLTGPWTPHPANPIRRDIASTRPGGTPIVRDGRVILPVQDCARTYGGAIRPLRIERLDTAHFTADAGAAIVPPEAMAPYLEGLHTLAAAGDVTLVDVKRRVLSPHGLAIEVRRHGRRLASRAWRR
ncbi:glucosamine inositolphosphorylceramide transferase family protein [Sphingomonas bacterium]|uniref:glucosamine inositolphosphorylceramide transferase family protein n=1 Tax=Sphingomonas bacterium TaxID=1895847 RepID=UPI00157754FB|nr:formyl transferase [Sphingomonas bacterium]